MQFQIALIVVSGSLSSHAFLGPAVGVIVAGLSFLLSGRVAHLGLFRSSESISVMNFSSRGILPCLCGTNQSNARGERRNFCRGCGCEVVGPNRDLLDKQMTRREIRDMTVALRSAGVRASRLELPPSITTLQELHCYLGSNPVVSELVAPPPPVEQPQTQ